MEASRISCNVKQSINEYFTIKDDGVIVDDKYMLIQELITLGILGDIKIGRIYKDKKHFSCYCIIGYVIVEIELIADKEIVNINEDCIYNTLNKDSIYNSISMRRNGKDFMFTFEGESIGIIELKNCQYVRVGIIIDEIEYYLTFNKYDQANMRD